MMKNNRRKINDMSKKFFLRSLLVRLLFLIVFILFEDRLGSYLYIDDWKYEEYAKIYSQISNSIIDSHAFSKTDHLMGGIKVAKLFFRYNAVLYYFCSSTIFLRICNIILSSLVIYPLVRLANELFGLKTANLAACIYTFFPYYIFMSVFVFKDNMVLLFLVSSLYQIANFYHTDQINIVKYIALSFPLMWLRDGLFLFSFLMLVWVYYWKQPWKVRQRILLLIPIFILISAFLFKNTLFLLFDRFNYYMKHGRSSGGGITLVRIDSVSQLYKLPLTWIFSLLLPLNTSWSINRWSDLLMLLNYIQFFLMVAYFLYIFRVDKKNIEKVFFVPLLLLHLLVIILVINIPRHYYFLHFYIIIFSSAYIAKLKTNIQLYQYLLLVVTLQVSFISLNFIA